MSKSISVIIPTYNGENLLGEILPNLYGALEKADAPYEVIICDDGSTDGTATFVRSNYPDTLVLENALNAGFSVSANRGAAAASCDLLFMLNNDVKLTENYFLPLFRYFDKEDTFGVNGRVIGWEDDRIQDAAKRPYFCGAKLKTNRNYYYRDNAPAEVYTFYLTGSNALVDRRKFMEMGGFDEVFSPFYCEDLELSVRAWKAGWKCYYEHNAICRHKVSATTSGLRNRKYVKVIYNRNKFLFHYLHLSGARLACYLLQVGLEAVGRMLLLNVGHLRSLFFFFSKVRDMRNRQVRAKPFRSGESISEILDFMRRHVRERDIVSFKK